MKTYNVNEIAKMLNTNPETVRRWVRNKKLHAETVSRKDGTVITESELEKFLDASPKYARIAALGLGLAAPVAVPIAVSTMLGGAVLSALEFMKNTEVRVHSEEIKRLLTSELENVKNQIGEKEVEIEKQQQELEYLKHREEQIKEVLTSEVFQESITDDK